MIDGFLPSDKPGSVRSKIEHYILTAGLRPGDPMPTELELCSILGVGRSSVREAMRTLIALDIIEVKHGTGTFVGHLTLNPLVHSMAFRSIIAPDDAFGALRSIIEVRRSLDLGQSEIVVAKLKGKTSPELRRLVNKMVACGDQGIDFSEYDRAFHRTLLDQTSNEFMRDLVDAFWEINSILVKRMEIPTPDDVADTIYAHRLMLDAAEAGDLSAYREAVDTHYQPLLRVLKRSEN